MGAKIFLFGRPGSGKSTIVRLIEAEAREKKLATSHIRDLPILYEMFYEDTRGRFEARPDNDFDVIDFSVYDEALQKLEAATRKQLFSVDLALIEFARDNYENAFHLFSRDFVRDNSFFLFTEASIDICLSRVHTRNNSTHPDAHATRSDRRYQDYYGKNNMIYMTTQFTKDFHIDDNRLLCISNEDSQEKLTMAALHFAERELLSVF